MNGAFIVDYFIVRLLTLSILIHYPHGIFFLTLLESSFWIGDTKQWPGNTVAGPRLESNHGLCSTWHVL